MRPQFGDEAADAWARGFAVRRIVDGIFELRPINRERFRRMIAPVKPLTEKEIAEMGRGEASRCADQWTGQLRNHVAPRHDDLLPVGRIDRKAEAVTEREIIAVDQFDAAPV